MPEPTPRSIGYRNFGFYQNPDIRGSLLHLVDAVGAGSLTPRVSEIIRPPDVGRAHAALEAGGVRGRFVVGFSHS